MSTLSPQWTVEACEHRWEYFVEVATQKVRTKACVDCGQRRAMPVKAAKREAEARLTA